MGGLQMSNNNKKYHSYFPRNITPEDGFAPQELIAPHLNYTIPSTIEGSMCEVATRDNENLGSIAERVRELFFARSELISRAMSGSYLIAREEALDELRQQYNATKDPKLEVLLHFPWNNLPVRFRKVINRARAKATYFVQAEIRLESQTGIYLFYFNFISCDISYPSFTRYSYVTAIESSTTHGFVNVYFALTCPSNGNETGLVFTENIVKGIAHWVQSQKNANNNVPLSCVPSSYYSILEDVRRHPVVLDLSNNWANFEKTDKAKHLFEDVGIVAYIATYWLANDVKDIRFVDIGCGNGVVSYLLNSIYGNRVKGVGYDVKARKIWNYYQSKGHNVLQVQTITPNFPSLVQPFPSDTNYIIGIHTDEMTPWIPLMAMKRRCDFFLLPCCPYDFYGKYVKRNQNHSENTWEYFEYIVSLAQTLGFDVKTDNLKIPSEKKTAIIGTISASRPLLCDINPQWENVVQKLMEPSFKANNYKGFQPRPSEIPVKNCSQLPVEVRNSINQSLVDILLTAADPEIGIPIKDIIPKLSDEQVDYLKSQNGGLQTFVKNNRIGYYLINGNVALRNTVNETYRLPKTSNYPCFFEQFLPQKCQHRQVCGYKHEDQE